MAEAKDSSSSMMVVGSEPLSTITHCIFDMDGLLLDTESLYTVAQQQILERFGQAFTWDLKAKMMGRKALEAAQVLIDDLQLQGQLTAEEFVREREELLDKLFPDCKVLPGVERLLRHLHQHGVPMAVATSSHQRHFLLKTSKHQELFKLFDHVVTADKVTRGKPDPQLFQIAASSFQGSTPEPRQCLVFEDAPSGVAAALAARMYCVMVPDANLDPQLTRLGAHQVLSSMEAFKPEQWGLPAFAAEQEPIS